MSESGARTIGDLSLLEYAERHIRARYASLLRTDEMQAGVYVLPLGGQIPAHWHSASWDFALILDGDIEAQIGDGADARIIRCGPHAVNLCRPARYMKFAIRATTLKRASCWCRARQRGSTSGWFNVRPSTLAPVRRAAWRTQNPPWKKSFPASGTIPNGNRA